MRVLLIEDDSAMAKSIELMLRGDGLNVYTTEKLANATGGDSYIETEWGRGYVLCDPIDKPAAAA